MKIKTKKELIMAITEEEGKKVSMSIAQVSEVVKIICDIVARDPGVLGILVSTLAQKLENED